MPRRAEGSIAAFAVALVVGVLWLAVETGVAAATLPSISLPEFGARILRLLPWHLAIFGAAGLGLGLLAPGSARSPVARFWFPIGAGSFAFLGARVLEAQMRTGGPAAAAVGVVATALGIGVAVAAIAGASRLLPARLRARWHAAAGVAWIALLVMFLERAGYEIGRAQGGSVASWLSQLGARDLPLLALPAAAALVARRPLRARALLAATALAALPFAARLAESAPAPAARPTPPPAAPDVIVLVLDTMRGDHLGRVIDGASATPRLDALASQSVVFSHAFSPSNWTRGSMPGLLASLPYEVVGNVPAPGVPTLATELARAGFHTAGASANPLVSARLGWARGHDEVVDPHSMGDLLVTHPLQMAGAAVTAPSYRVGAATNAVYFRGAAEMRRRGLDLLDRAPRPAFLHLQAMDAHGPYLPPHEWLPRDFSFGDVSSYYAFMKLRGRGVIGTDAFRPRLDNFRQRYAASVRYLDAEMGVFLDALRRRGRYDEAMIWVVSDHGEGFGEHDVAGHTGLALGDELVRIPLLVKLPKAWGIAPRVETAPVSAYSIVPTTLSLLGLPPVAEAFGEDLSPLLHGDPAAAPPVILMDSVERDARIYAAIRWPWKLVAIARDRGPLEVQGLFDLSSADAEERSHAGVEPARVAALLGDVEAFRARVTALAASAAPAGIDAATEEQLRRLGYIE